MQPSENNQLNLDYAQEWLTYLKRRNAVLTIVWPVLLMFLILASLVAFYYYQLEQTSKLSLSIEIEKSQSLEEVQLTLQSEITSLTTTNTELKTELEGLINSREELSVLNNDSTSKLNITSQMVDNLNQLVIELKNEREDLSTKLEDSLETIAQLQNQHEQMIKQKNKETTDSIAGLNKQIDSRKTAYQALANRQEEMRDEMNRLNDLVISKEKIIDKLKKDNQNIETRLTNKNSEIETYKNKLMSVQKNYSELETKLNAIMSPIGSTNFNNQESKNNNTQQTEQSRKITGLEDIKRPAVEKKAIDGSDSQNESQSFNHNQISILP
tara:strand:+ start:11853 stop:12830 length:978 start_codon:yes stop_codon:yes gene_type:complete